MSAKELERFILARNRDAVRFDIQPTKMKVRDLDAARVERFLRQAEFEDIAGIFIARFGRPQATAAEPVAKEPGVSGKGSVKTSVKTSVKILAVLKERPQMTIPELAFSIGVSARSIERNIGKLQREGRLRRIGPDKGGHWEVQP